MNSSKQIQKTGGFIAAFVCFLLLAIAFLLSTNTAQAAPGINQQMNFQGRLFSNDGAVIADGEYNMEFKIVSGGNGCTPASTFPCGGSVEWTETRTGGNKVTVRNGYFSVELGSVSTLPADIWNDDTLWLSMNIGGTGSPSWDGEMQPLKRLSASPYAFNAARLGGMSAANFLQLAQGVQTDSSTTNASIAINKTGSTAPILDLQRAGNSVLTVNNNGSVLLQNSSDSTTAFQIQNQAGTSDLLIADTVNTKIGIGVAPSSSLGILQVGATGSTGAANGITFGGDSSASIYRSQNGEIGISGYLKVSGEIGSRSGDAYTQIGLTGPSAQGGISVNYDTSLYRNGVNQWKTDGSLSVQSLAITGIAAPAAPTITQTGTAGSSFYLYQVVAVTGSGKETNAVVGFTLTGNAALSGSNYNVLTWPHVSGASTYKVYRTSGGGTQGLLATIDANPAGLTYNDVGDTAIAGTASQVNKTDLLSGGSALFKNIANSTTAFQVQNAAGTSALNIDTTTLKATFGGNVALNTTGSSIYDPRTLSFDVVPGSAWRFANQDAGVSTDGLQGGYGQKTQMYSYWGLVLSGNRQTSAPAYASGAFDDASVTVDNTDAAHVGLRIQGTSDQSADLIQALTGSSTVFKVSAEGSLTSASWANFGYNIDVNNLSTSDKRVTVGGIGPSGEGGIQIGYDTSLYRLDAASLQTDGTFNALGGLFTSGGLVATGGASFWDGAVAITDDAGPDTQPGLYINGASLYGDLDSGTLITPTQLQVGFWSNRLGGFGENGSIAFANDSNGQRLILQGSTPSGSGDATISFPVLAGGSSDTICLQTLGNCGGGGGGGGDAYLANDQTFTGYNIFRNGTNSTTAFQIQNAAASVNLFVADTVNGKIGVGGSTNSGNTAQLQVSGGISSGGGIVSQYGQSGQITIGSVVGGSAGLAFGEYSDAFLYHGGTGQIILKPGSGADNAGAFQIQNAAGTSDLFIADTANNKIGIGQAPDSGYYAMLQVAGAISSNSNINATGTIAGGDLFAYSTYRVSMEPTTFGTVAPGDVVIYNEASDKYTTTTVPRDPRVKGVNVSDWTTMAIIGRVTVNVDSGAVAVGDQLVTSATAGHATVDNNATTGIVGRALTSKSAGSNGTVTVQLQINSGQSSPTFRNQSNSTTAFQIQNSSGSNVFTADTQNGRIGVGTAAPTRSLDVAVNNSSTNALPLIVQQAGSGDVGIEVKNPSQSYYLGIDASDSNTFKISSSAAGGNQANMGSTSTAGSSVDSGITNSTSFARVTAPITGTVSTTRAYLEGSGTGNNKVQMAIYASSSGLATGSPLAISNEITTSAGSSWYNFTFSSPPSVTSGVTYFLAYTSNGENNAYYRSGSSNQSGYKSFTYSTGSFPSASPSYSQTAAEYTMYAIVTASSASDNLDTSLLQITSTGATTFQNSVNSSSAFQIQNAGGSTIFNVDTSTGLVTIGSSLQTTEINLGTQGVSDGTLIFANMSNPNRVYLQASGPVGFGDANIYLPSIMAGDMDTICLELLGNCGGGGASAATLAGAGLIDNGSAIDIGAGTGITVGANAISINQGAALTWSTGQTFSSGLTVSGGNFTIGGDAFNDLTGNGLRISSNALTINLTTAADGLSSTTASSSGLEVLGGGLTLLQGCSDGQVLAWSETSDVWGCTSADLDTLYARDSDKIIAVNNTSGLTFNLTTTGDFTVQDNGTTVFQVNDDGTALFRSSSNSASALQIQNSTSKNILSVDTSGSQTVFGHAGSGGVVGKATFLNATNSNTASIQSGTTSSSYTLTLPTALPGSSQCLQSSNAGVMSWTSCGGGGGGGADTLNQSYQNGGSQYDSTILLDTTRSGVIIQDASSPIGGDLFAIQAYGATATYLGVTASEVTMQDANGYNAVVIDLGNSIVKVFENVGSPSNYAQMYYASGEAVFSASSGTTRVGSGSGNISMSLTGNSDVLTFSKTSTPSGSYSLNDFKITRVLTGGSNSLQGSVLKVEDLSTFSGGSSSPDLVLINQNNSSATGNLINGQQAGSSKFTVSNAGTVTIASGQSYTGAGALTLDSASGTTLSIGTGANAHNTIIGNSTGSTGLTLNSGSGGISLTSTSGNIVIGASDSTGTLVVLDTDSDATFSDGSASNSPTVVNGAMFYSSTNHSFMCGVAGSWQTCNGLLYSNTSASSAVNTCTNNCAAFNKAIPIPANYCQPGRTVHIVARGTLSVTGTPNIAMEVRYGTDATTRANDSLIGSTTNSTSNLSTGVSNVGWYYDVTIICFSTTSMMAQGTLWLQTSGTNGSSMVMGAPTSATGSLTTNTAKNLYIFPTWSASNASNTMTLNQLIATGN